MKGLGTVISLGVNALIVLSTWAFCASTMATMSDDMHRNPKEWQEWKSTWLAIEYTCVTCFTIDVVVRGGAGYACGQWTAFKGDVMNWIDVFAIMPFYVQLFVATPDMRFLRVIRLARILKLMENTGYGNVGGTVYEIILSSSSALTIPIFFMILAIIVFSALLWNAEQTVSTNCATDLDAETCAARRGEIDSSSGRCVFKDWDTANPAKVDDLERANGIPEGSWVKQLVNEGCNLDSPTGCSCPGDLSYITSDGSEWSSEVFTSIPHATWWCIVTFTTVGYGDISPRTALGQWVNVFAMVTGIFFLSMPISIVGDAFIRAWGKVERNRNEVKEKNRAAVEAESLVQQLDEQRQEAVSSIGETEHDIKRHISRAKSYLDVLSGKETSTNSSGAKYSSVTLDLLTEAETLFDDVIALFKAKGLEEQRLRLEEARDQAELDAAAPGMLSNAEGALLGNLNEAQQWAEEHGDVTMRIGAKVTGKIGGVGYSVAKKAGGVAAGAAAGVASSAASKAAERVMEDD